MKRSVEALARVHVIENQKALLEDIVLPIHWIHNLHRQRVHRAILNDAENFRVVKVNGRKIHACNVPYPL